jgi:hypothetical protein
MKVSRGCGNARVAGGIYVTVPTSPNGRPIEYFLVDPPAPVDVDPLGLSPLGMRLIKRPGTDDVYDLWDIVGQVHYPSPADFVEEVRRIGASRRVQNNDSIDWAKVTPESRLVVLHARAYVENWQAIAWAWAEESKKYQSLRGRQWECPTGKHDGVAPDCSCVGLWYEGIRNGEPSMDPTDPPRTVRRVIPSGRYTARSPFEKTQPVERMGIVAILPMGLSVIRDRQGGRHESALKRVQRAGVPVVLEDE